MSSRRLLVVDGMSALYRAFYGIPGLSTTAGLPTNAVFGFIRMTEQLRAVWRPSHLSVAFDGGLPPLRLELLAEYKAQRPPMPESLARQIPLAEEYLERARVHWVRRQAEEADDIIAAILKWATPAADEVLIATTDKDLYQLVSDNVHVVSLSGKPQAMGPQEVKEKTGVGPSRIVEWLALVGDSVDNVPGVPGVGPKTAAKLLDQFGSLDALWSGLASVSAARVRDALVAHRDLVARNVRLMRLRDDLPVTVEWDQLLLHPQDPKRLIPFFERLELHSLAKALQQGDLFQ